MADGVELFKYGQGRKFGEGEPHTDQTVLEQVHLWTVRIMEADTPERAQDFREYLASWTEEMNKRGLNG